VSSAGTGDQFYVTHCGTTDSVLDAPGYTVRAASVSRDEQGSLLLAIKYPPYELPLEMWKERPSRANAPRRLARTKHPDGGLWVVHSVYLEKDTMDRDRSYFSHMLNLSAADPAAVLRSWDALSWTKEYARGASKTLPRGRLPVGTAISDDALAEFLSGTPNGPTELAVAVCPARLRASVEVRRELVARFLQALVLAEQARDRDRLFVHAEPGLVAMLLYAAVRLLPPAWTANLTFSTFEPHHRGIQDYKLATVVGTYFGVPGKGLERELVSERGYGLDTIRPDQSSDELSGPLPPGIGELIDLAATGEWELLADVHKLVGAEASALEHVKKAVALARGVGRLNRGEPTTDDLLALRADPRGAEALARSAEVVWPHVRAAALTDPRVRAAFKDWLAQPDRLDEFRREAAKSLARGDLSGWDTRWAVVRDVTDVAQRKVQVEKVQKNLDEYLPSMAFHARTRLREACAETGVWPDHHLLAPTSVEELNILLTPQMPAEWQGYACFAVIGPDEKNWLLPGTAPFRKAMRDRARKFLFGAPVAALGSYARFARPYLDSDPVFLLGLFQPYTPACRPLMDRLLRTDALEPADWVKLIHAVNLYAGDWDGFLLEGDRLTRLLVALGGEGVGRDVWKGYLDELSPALLSPVLAPPGTDGSTVHVWERTVYAQLRQAAEELTASGVKLVHALPPGGAAKLFAATDLVKWVEDPGLAGKLTDYGEAAQVCQTFGVSPLDLLRAAYIKGGFTRLELPRDAVAFEPLVTLFRACYPTDLDFRRSSTAVTQWLALSESCPHQTRAAFQAHLVSNFVPKDWHRDILEEPRQVPFLPAADARIREGLAVPPRKPTGERYAKPAARSSAEDDAAFASPATKRAKKERGPRSGGRRRRRDSDGSIWVWVAVAVIGIAAVIALIVIIQKLGGSKPTQPTAPDEPPPAKIEKEKAKGKK
jgi:hypothetical protein